MQFTGEERKVKKTVEYKLQLHAHNGSGFDSWVVLNSPPSDKHIVVISKNGKRYFSLRDFNGYTQKGKRQTRQYSLFRCGMTLLYYSLKIGV